MCKLDLEKAYDHADWSFLHSVMSKMGFGVKWTNWIQWFISRACFLVIVNGSPNGFFNSSRGLRQGDPLSPYLFVIMMEAFSRMVDRVVGGGFLLSCSIEGKRGEGIKVSHLLFVDDILIFVRPRKTKLLTFAGF